MAVARRTSQNVPKQYVQTKQTRKTQNVWRDVVRPSRFNAFFAIARFLVIITVVVVVVAVGLYMFITCVSATIAKQVLFLVAYVCGCARVCVAVRINTLCTMLLEGIEVTLKS